MMLDVRSARPAARASRRPDPEARGGAAGLGGAVAGGERRPLDPERPRELAELEEAIARTRRRLDELHQRYLEIVQGVLAGHVGPGVG